MDLDSILFVCGVVLIAVGLGLWHLPLALIWVGMACITYSVLAQRAKYKASALAAPQKPKPASGK